MRVLNVGRSTGSSSADAALNLEGSLMGSARAQPREAAQAQGPLGATLNDVVNALNPINWMGGFGGASGAVLGPIRTAAQKQAVQGLRRFDPALLEAVVKSPKQFNITVPGAATDTLSGAMVAKAAPDTVDRLLSSLGLDIAENYGTHRQVNPVLSQVNIHPNTLRGRAPSGAIFGSEAVGINPNLPGTVGHEVLHGFNKQFAADLSPDMQARLLRTILPQLHPEAKGAVASYMSEGEGGLSRALAESLSYLGEAARTPGIGGGPDARGLYEALLPKMIQHTDETGRRFINNLTAPR